MRVTNKMLANHAMSNLYAGLKRLDKLNSQLSSQKKIQRPSDDPVGTAAVMRLKTTLSQIEDHKANVDHATGVAESIDSALGDLGDVLQRAKTLAISGANGTLEETSREAIANEVDQLIDHIIQVGNSTFAGSYVFGYNRTDEAPFTKDSSGNILFLGQQIQADGTVPDLPSLGDGSMNGVEIDVGVTIDVRVPGDKAFGKAIASLQELKSALMAGDSGDFDKAIGNIQEAMDVTLQYRAETGAKMKRLEITQGRLADLELSTETLLSETAGIDVAETIMNLKMEENAYQLALSVNARIIQPTLMDFLN